MDKQSKEKNKNMINNTNSTKKKKKHTALKVFLVILLILLIAVAIFMVRVQQNGGGITGILKTSLGHDNDTVNKLDKIYCLILGQSQGLTDTIILASYDPKTQEAAMLSIPRDTFVGQNKDYAGGMDKINAIYQTGVENLLQDVREITGIDVRYYLKVDTEALKVLVDEIGGVYFDVPIDMHYTDRGQNLYIDLKAGYQLLDGDKAEQLVRFRHNSDGSTYPYEYGMEDLGRMRTQKEFLKELLRQTIENMDINTVISFLDIAEQYVETNLNFDAIKDYVPYVFEYNVDNLKTDTLPGISEQAAVTGTWIYTVYEDEVPDVINKLFYNIEPEQDNEDTNTVDGNTVDSNTIDENTISEGTTSEPEIKDITIEVLNGTRDTNNLNEVVAKLESAGYTVTQTGNTSATSSTTIIAKEDVKESLLNELQDIAETEYVTTGSSERTTDVTIIIGADY